MAEECSGSYTSTNRAAEGAGLSDFDSDSHLANDDDRGGGALISGPRKNDAGGGGR